MSLYTARTIGGGTDAIGTTLPTFRLGLIGPTIYNGSADPTVTPPTPMDDGFSDGDLYIRGTAGGSAIWVYDTLVWSQIASGSAGGSFAGDIIMTAGAQFLGDPAADATAPAFAFNGDEDTGIFQVGANELGFSTGGTQALVIESDGTLASTVVAYETLVLADNDIPNRKYVEDTFVNISGDSMTGDLSFGPGAQLLIASGSAADPGIAFSLDPDNGFYLDGTDSIGVSAGGNEIANFNADGIQMRNGAQFIGDGATAGTPSISFIGDLTTGIFHDGNSGEVAMSAAGTETIRFDATTATGTLLWQGGNGALGTPAISFSGDSNTGFFWTGTGAIAYSSDGVNVLGISGTAMDGSLRWLGPDGTEALPAISFSGDGNSGMFNAGTDIIGFSAGGTEIFRVTTTNIRALDGSVASPAYSFTAEPNTGMYRQAAGLLGFDVLGTERLRLTTVDARFLEPIRGDAATAAIPSFSFTTDTDTGIYSSAANALGFSTGGVGRWTLDGTGDILPVANNVYDIGNASFRVNTVFATTFDGTATAAQYSDLAERYSVGSCCEPKPGDVVVICDHEDHDICNSLDEADDRVLGVVSTKPAFMMNSDAGDDDTAPYIALRGRVPVNVYGVVRKGDLLITSADEGVARALTAEEKDTVSPHAVFGKALSYYDGDGIGQVEAVIL